MFRLITLLSLVAITALSDADFDALKSQAETGDAEAQFELGTCYLEGQGVEKDPVLSVQWLQKAAAQDYGPAVVSLVYRYEKGEGVEQDLDEATRWYEKALKLGYTRDLEEQEELKDHAAYFYELDAGLRRQPDSPGDHYVAWIGAAIEAKEALNLEDEIDPWLESLAADFSNDWKMLRAVAMGYFYAANLGDYFFELKVDGRIVSGNEIERNRWLGLKLMEKAYALAEAAHTTDSEMASLTRDYLLTLLQEREIEPKLLSLKTTDLDVEDAARYGFGRELPTDLVFFARPSSPALAKNDGELAMSLLGRYDIMIGGLTLPKEAQLPLAKAILVMIGGNERRFSEADRETLHHLADDEYLVFNHGIEQVKNLPADYLFIPELNALVEESPEIVGQTLGEIFKLRYQLERAASVYDRAGDTHAVRTIRANQGTFTRCRPQPAGAEATIEYTYRNGKELEIELFRIDAGRNLLKRLEEGTVLESELDLLKGDSQWFRDIGGFDQPNTLEKVQSRTVSLAPLSDHRTASTKITLGALGAGNYLVRANMAGGNTVETTLNIYDTMLYFAPTPSEVHTNAHTLFILCDALTGKPRPNEKITIIQIHGGTYRDENEQIVENPYDVDYQFKGTTDANGCYVLEERLLTQPDAPIHLLANLDGYPLVMDSYSWDRRHAAPYETFKELFVTTDRPIYRPGDTGHFMVWQVAETNSMKPRILGGDFELPISGEPILHPNLFGAMKAAFEIPAEAPLGRYHIERDRKDESGYPWGEFQVEKYRAPEFEVAIHQLDDGKIEISANYAYGAPVAGGKVYTEIEFNEFVETTPEPWYPTAAFDGLWGKGYWWQGEQFSEKEQSFARINTLIEAELDQILDAQGKAIIDPTSFENGDKAMGSMGFFSVDAVVTDAAEKSYDAGKYFENNVKTENICCWAEKAFYETNETIVVHTASEKEDALTLHYDRIAGTDAFPLSESEIKNLTPGLYQVKARDAAGAESKPFQFFVQGDADNGLTAENPIRIVVEKGIYNANETATILVQVDEPGRYVYFFDRLTSWKAYSIPRVILMDETCKQIELPVNGAAGLWQCAVMTVVDGKYHIKAGSIHAVENSKIAGHVEIATDQPTYKPGATVKVELRALNNAGEGEPCAVAITVYNKMLDSLIRRSSAQAIYKTLFSSWIDDDFHGLDFDDAWPGSIAPTAPKWVMSLWGGLLNNIIGYQFAERETMGGGGGGVDDLFGEADSLSDSFGGDSPSSENYLISAMKQRGTGNQTVHLREDLADHAYWNAFVETDENGEASVEFPIPDTMTEWKVMAWAVHTNFAASGETSFTCAKDLVVQLNTPRFMVEGDELEISASVRNHTTNTLMVVARSSLSMLSTVIKALEPGAEKLLYWTYTARQPGEEPIEVTASSQGIGDGESKSVPVLPHSILKRGGDSGILTEHQQTAQIEIEIPEAVDPESLVLDLNASPNMLETVAGALPFLAEYPHGCTEQTLNKFLPAVMVLQTLETLGLELEDLTAAMPPERQAVFDRDEIIKRAQVGMTQLEQAQRWDEDWSWNLDVNSGNADPLVTAWVVRGLAAASKLDELNQYRGQGMRHLVFQLKTATAPPWRRKENEPLTNTDVLTAVVLQEIGPQNWLTNERVLKISRELMPTIGPFLMKHTGELSLYGKTLLAYFFELRGDTAPRDELMAYIEQYLETDPNLGTVWLRVKSAQWWLWQNDEIEIMAWYLKLLNRVEPNSSKTAGVARWLLINRQHGDHWKSTRDTAICVEALCEFIVNNPTAARGGSVAALLNGAAVELGLKPGMNTLELTSDSEHPTFFDVAWQFQTLENPIAAERSDLVGVSRAYYRVDVKTGERTRLGESDALKAGETIEVELSFEALQELEYLLATDFKPAGFENVETLSGYRHDGLRHYQEIHDERIACYINRLPKGISNIRYRLRAEHAGRVCAMPATIELMYAPKNAANSKEGRLKSAR
ncbi:alpha-2-macroglobulin family protein [Pontiellaceae bacterium B1224]|nr:alpha-2-macroglobulin family protein [Pontiellaceae bacterium B1224]